MESVNYDLPLNSGWKFHLGEIPNRKQVSDALFHTTCQAGGALAHLELLGEQTRWEPVTLPHDWLTEQPCDETADSAGGFKTRGTGWYFLRFFLPDKDITWARLVFDGVLGSTEVYVNGVPAAQNFSGYNRFSCEIGSYLQAGAENTLVLHVDARRWEGWWYEGAGLYRPVRIEFRGGAFFNAEKSFLRGEETDGLWYVTGELQTEGTAEEKNISITASLMDEAGNPVAVRTFPGGSSAGFRLPVPEPRLWSPETPYLYTLICRLTCDGVQCDCMEKQIGLRSIVWDKERGMCLNGRSYRIKGVCCHQDHAGVGAAVTDEIMAFRISQLKKLGVNAYRCAHHAPSEKLLELCDRMGMLVMVENRHFSLSEQVLEQLDSLVYVSRNHTSVFLYSLFNEEAWQSETRGRRIAAALRSRILSLDPTRMVVGAQNGGLLTKDNASDALDVIGVNYCLGDYDAIHERSAEKVLLGTENCPIYATRGEYKTEPARQVFANYADEWGSFSESLEETMETVLSKAYTAGCFAWCGFDYRGEPNPYGWPSVLSHWGFCDICGFQKDTAYLLAAWYQEKLCVHLLPHWNWHTGDLVRVCTYTNGVSAELFLNGVSFGEKTVNRRRAEWMVPFAGGCLRVQVRRGEENAFAEVRTAGEAAQLVAEAVEVPYGAGDSRIVNICVADRGNTVLPDYAETVRFTLKDGEILGVGNGDPNAHLLEKASEIRLFHGRAQIIVSSDTTEIRCCCPGLPDRILKL